MKKFISILLLFGITCQLFSSGFIYAGFELNQKYIAAKLCENKDKPEMHCNGHCQLKKQLKEDEKNQTSAPVNPKASFEISFCNTIEKAKFYNETLLSIVNTFYDAALPCQPVEPVFHPPGC